LDPEEIFRDKAIIRNLFIVPVRVNRCTKPDIWSCRWSNM